MARLWLLAVMLACAACASPGPAALPPGYQAIGFPDPTLYGFSDGGEASPSAGFRALVALPIQNDDQLAQVIAAMSMPSNPTFRHYLTPAQADPS